MTPYTHNLIIIFLFIVIIYLLYWSISINVEAYINKPKESTLSTKVPYHYKFEEANCNGVPIKFSFYYYSNPFQIYLSDGVIKNLIKNDYTVIQSSVIQNKELTILSPVLSQQFSEPFNNTEKGAGVDLVWYVQERPSCSNIILSNPEELKRNGINVVDFRDSRLGELSPKGAPSQQCLACNNCIDAYLLILTDIGPSSSLLEGLGFKQVESIEEYINKMKYGK